MVLLLLVQAEWLHRVSAARRCGVVSARNATTRVRHSEGVHSRAHLRCPDRYATPAPTLLLPEGCGVSEVAQAGENASGLQGECAQIQAHRRSRQRPFYFHYVPKPGPDGYWMLEDKMGLTGINGV